MADDNKTGLMIIVVVVLGLFTLFLNRPTTTQEDIDWQTSYQKSIELAGLNPVYFDHNQIVDRNDQIAEIAKDIVSKSTSAKDAVKRTLDYVYNSVTYSRQISSNVCYAETATDVLERGRGDCVSMSKLVLALLREEGIAARPAGGCISGNFQCGVLYSAHPDRAPRYEPVDIDDPKKRGGLHEWTEIWLPEEGWVIGESTSGQIFSKSCQSYDYHDYNTDAVGMCVITDSSYIRQCARF